MNESILLAYARAMRSAQRLEARLKLLFSLHVVCGASKAITQLTDEEFEALLSSSDNKTMGQALRGVLHKLHELWPIVVP